MDILTLSSGREIQKDQILEQLARFMTLRDRMNNDSLSQEESAELSDWLRSDPLSIMWSLLKPEAAL